LMVVGKVQGAGWTVGKVRVHSGFRTLPTVQPAPCTLPTPFVDFRFLRWWWRSGGD
jgi:hypothetical protein